MPSSAYGFHRTQLNSVRVTFTNFMVFGGAIWTILNCLKRVYGGETGIRTLDTLRYTRFPSVRLQPLGHLSAVKRTNRI
jgi:hypothetical protein